MSTLAQPLRTVAAMFMLQQSRTVACGVFVALALLSPQIANAQFEVTAIKLILDDGSLLKESDLKEFFNKARCECSTPLQVKIEVAGYQAADYSFQVVAGYNCLDPDKKFIKSPENGGKCVVLFGPVRANTLVGDRTLSTYGSGKNPITFRTLMQEECVSIERQEYAVTVYTDQDGDGQWEELNSQKYTVDTQPPDSPRVDSDATHAGESQVTVTFRSHTDEDPTSDAGGTSTVDPNFKGYQVLCAVHGSGAPALANPPNPEYDADVNLCGDSCQSVAVPSAGDAGTGSDAMTTYPLLNGDGGIEGGASEAGPQDATTSDAGPSDATPGLDAGPIDAAAGDTTIRLDTGASASGNPLLCAQFVCSERKQTPGDVTVGGLQNEVAYDFWVVTIDQAGNPSEPVFIGTDMPALVEDLWERYKREGGTAEGGCFVATAAYGDVNHPHVRVLREFRDQVLLPSPTGRLFVAGYYEASPGPAGWLARHDGARWLVRTALWPVTVAAGTYLYTGWWHKGMLFFAFTLALGLPASRRRRRAAKGGSR